MQFSAVWSAKTDERLWKTVPRACCGRPDQLCSFIKFIKFVYCAQCWWWSQFTKFQLLFALVCFDLVDECSYKFSFFPRHLWARSDPRKSEVSLRSWREIARECFCFACKAVALPPKITPSRIPPSTQTSRGSAGVTSWSYCGQSESLLIWSHLQCEGTGSRKGEAEWREQNINLNKLQFLVSLPIKVTNDWGPKKVQNRYLCQFNEESTNYRGCATGKILFLPPELFEIT